MDRKFSKFYEYFSDEDAQKICSALNDLTTKAFKDKCDEIVRKKEPKVRLRDKDRKAIIRAEWIIDCLLQEVHRLEHEVDWRDECLEQWKKTLRSKNIWQD